MSGPKVWLDYDQKELDDQYNQRILVPDANDYLARNLELSIKVRREIKCQLDVSYGPSEDEVLDIFPVPEPKVGGSPVVVFVHGGAWTRWTKDYNSYQAPAFVNAGAIFVSVNFSLVPAVDLDELVRQNRAAVGWVYTHAREFGADPDKLYVAGQSSGAHVAGLLAVTNWAEWGLPADAVKGVVAASGMYELTPVRLSSRNGYLHLDEAAVKRNSAIGQIPDVMPPMVIVYGGGELDEFRRQSKAFAGTLRDLGHSCQEIDLPRLNHFEVAEEFADPASPLMQATYKLMGL